MDPLFPFEEVGRFLRCDESKDPFLLKLVCSGSKNWEIAAALGESCGVFLVRAKLMSVVDREVVPVLYRIRAVLSMDPGAGSCGVTSACHFAMGRCVGVSCACRRTT